ncbi:MAG TPA: cobalamin-dependent protein [Desulfatiglandales bacterium]|nr:cobalamin-dependent protein [Desulfatiglandales bacterium]
MDEVGRRMKSGKMLISEVILSAKAMQGTPELLRPYLSEGSAVGKGTIAIGALQGYLHVIGKNLVAMLLERAGFHVVDLGIDVKTQDFMNAVKEHSPKIMGMSALSTATMPKLQETKQR